MVVTVGQFIDMKYYMEVLQEKTERILGKNVKRFEIISKVEFPTKAKAKSQLAKKEINSNQKKQIHLCTHDDTNSQPCEIING